LVIAKFSFVIGFFRFGGVVSMEKKNSSVFKGRILSIDCEMCGRLLINDWFMVKERIWVKEAKMDKGLLCLDCLEKVIGRKLTIKDFKKVPCNYPIMFGYKMGKRER
jgi:hypothetical protein